MTLPGHGRFPFLFVIALAGVVLGGSLLALAADSDRAALPERRVLPMLAADGLPTPDPAVPYTVRAGDNLWAIARLFGTNASAVVSLNHLANANAIVPGQVLVVLEHGPAPAPPVPPASAAVISLGDPNRRQVAFSFDAGSDAGYTTSILATLQANGITASFGMTGRWAEQYPDLLRRIVAGGHHLINHSYDHPDFTTISSAARKQQLDQTDAIVVGLTGGIGTKPYFRPPFGAYNASVNADLAADGYFYSLYWTVDSLGWNGLSAAQIVERCLSRAQPGAIYLFHVGSQSQDGPALQTLIDGLRAAGYTIGSIPDVMGQ
ncbi:MAG: polysaccharide deacetylase family protein [Dehalococcoidia bacterium]|nr:polysaccharide deacetylase family protein [Dehalococcoidia bacterium]